MRFLLFIPTFIFWMIVFIRNKLYDFGIFKSYTTRAPVISVGNLAVGGTGKTPFVIYLANHLKSIGFTPGIIGRGYGRISKDMVIVFDGENLVEDPDLAGDEMILIAKQTGCFTISHNTKWEAAQEIEMKFNLDVIIIDDGFQHRKLKRDLDIVLLKNDDIEKPYLMPMGRLREPLSNMRRAQLVGRHKDSWTKKLKRKAHLAVTFVYDDKFGKPYNLFSNEEVKEVEENVVLTSSIARNLEFYDTVNNLGLKIHKHYKFADHHKYTDNDIKMIIDGTLKLSDVIITTEKDAVKLFPFKETFDEFKINVLVIPKKTVINANLQDFYRVIHEILNKN